MKIIAFYLPQFHEIPENNKWWGKGFTEWVNVRKAEKLFEGHNQPRIPLNNNYYNLLDDKVKEWQIKIAKKNGVYGFCIYHYWFDGKLLLEKPVEQFLQNKKLNINFCICWANEHWTNAWTNSKSKVLIEQKYGNEKDWKKHFDYLLPFFKDERYIKENNKPLFVIYRPEIIDCLKPMISFFNEEAKKNGFDGIAFAYQNAGYTISEKCDESLFEFAIEYQPNCAQVFKGFEKNKFIKRVWKNTVLFFEQKFKINLREKVKGSNLRHYDYDKIWKFILKMKPRNEKCIPGAFVDWDNTPRRGKRGFVIDGANPQKFKEYMSKQIKKAKEEYKKDKIFIFSWNEWAEGGYLEPDEKNKDGYLKAIKEALKENNEFED